MMTKKSKSETVYRMMDEGRSDKYIMGRTRISQQQLAGYKAARVRKENDPTNRLEEYVEGKRTISIPTKLIKKRLRKRQIPRLVEILDTVFSEESELENHSNTNGESALPKDKVREIVYSLMDQGKEYEKIYNSKRLEGVPKKSITAHIAVYNRE